MNKFIKNIKDYFLRKKQQSLNLWLERYYNVTVKNGKMFIVNGETPVVEINSYTTINDVIEQLKNMKESFKSFNQ